MPEAAPTPDNADQTPPTTPPRSLAEVRAELDRIDDTIHDLLMERAGIVAQGITAAKTGLALHPGREAQIIRLLLARH